MTAPIVLLADDSATVRALARFELEQAGYTVLEAEDGQQAVDAARAHHPDVVLLDIEMPVLDGYDTIRALKADPSLKDVPVVFLTGRAGSQDVVQALQLGGHDYLRKPPQPAELLARVSAALRVKVLQDELRRRAEDMELMSRTDFLTGLHNRRHMEEHLRMLTSGSRRHGYSLAVLVLDIDHFKLVNDSLGHEGGDDVLRAVAERLRSTLRTEDVLGRWGGEEFLVLAPHTGELPATVLAERLRAAVSVAPVVAGDQQVLVTISIGGAAAEEPGTHALLTLADGQLYAAKAAGRDCVRLTLSRPGG